jgi:hypothetical protein
MAESKFDKYIIRHPMFIDPSIYSKDPKVKVVPPNRFLEGPVGSQVPSNTLVEYYWVTEPRIAGNVGLRGGPQEHYFDEIFCWISTNTKDSDDLGGEVEFWMGMGKDTEKIKLNTSSCIYCPGNVAHMPIIYRNVKRPFLCIVIGVGITVVNAMTTKRYGPQALEGLGCEL